MNAKQIEINKKLQSLCDNLSVNENGTLLFAGESARELADAYGTPLYVMDEKRIRQNARVYLDAFKKYFPEGSMPLYASKANSFKQIYRIMKEEGMGIDVVSSGEICTAAVAGFPLENAYFHSNNKTDSDILYGMEKNVGFFVADSIWEIDRIEAIAASLGKVQNVLLRITPGIDPHTYKAVCTGQVDSKFGSAIETGQAEEITAYTLKQPHINLEGFHCHVGSQVFSEDVFERASIVMLEFANTIREKYGYAMKRLNLGGGYGVRYVEDDPRIDIGEKIGCVAEVIKNFCEEHSFPMPLIFMEPGRSIVADAGLTLYTVGSVKQIPGYKNYVSVDGGMTDNPRFALYGSRYTVLAAEKLFEDDCLTASVVGRCCESGDIIQENVYLPSSITRGDILAVSTTGAYNYSMSSNYNRIPRPPVVMVKGAEDCEASLEKRTYVAVKRESVEDISRLDV